MPSSIKLVYWRVRIMIRLSEIDVENRNEFGKDVCPRIRDLLLKERENQDFDAIFNYCSCDGQLNDAKIERLITGDILTLKEAISQIGVIVSDSVIARFKREYDNFCRRKLGKKWAQMMGVTTCPDCNRSYIFTSNKSGTRPQYDHYFPKSKYPYLAISMYNLIPCCSICNSLKQDADTYTEPFIYPYEDSYGERVTFVANGVDAESVESWLGAAAGYQIKIEYSEEIDRGLKEKISRAAETLKLEELYSKHGDYVKDILRTAYIYDDTYFGGLVTQYPDLFNDKHEAKNFVFFNYLEEESWGKRVLAKLTHDIVSSVE